MELFKVLNNSKYIDLETIEEKSFWIVAILTICVGIMALFTCTSYSAPWPTIFEAVFCVAFPVTLMVIVSKNKNYHSAYPILCTSLGAIALPICFIYSGGFLSGMPFFCVVGTSITVLCYSPRLRYMSLILSLIGSTLAFIYVYHNGTPYPIVGSEALYLDKASLHPIYNDILFGYYLSVFTIFFSVHFVVSDIRRYKINQDTLQKFFDREKRNEILKNVMNESLSINSQNKKAVIVFADISSFTTITERMSSDLILSFLNDFFSCAEERIHSTNGIIDKFIGDCVMAYWLDNEEENCVLNAVQAMLDLKLDMFKRAEFFYRKYKTELNFKVGMAYGDVILGDIGSTTMHDFTIIGDAVNVANRIESFAAAGEMLMSEEAAQMVGDKVILENVESNHFFKGKNRPIDLYRIIGLPVEKQKNPISVNTNAGYRVYVCGCRGSVPVSGIRFAEYGGETSCYVVKKDDYAAVIDCGTGLKNAEDLLADCKNIDILLTHLHYDHILGFLMAHFPDKAKIRLFANFDAWAYKDKKWENFMERPYWPVGLPPLEKIVIETNRKYTLNDDVSVTFYPSDHPDESCVIKLMCENKKIVFLFDCECANSLPEDISDNSDLLFFDGMYDDNDPVNHVGWGHGTWQDGVRFIENRSIKKLVITHHNPGLGDLSLKMNEIQAHEKNSNISFAKSGDVFYI